MLRMKWFAENYCIDGNGTKIVLDIGSYCFSNRPTYRDVFSGNRFNYIGLDMVEGPNVSIAVKTPYKWSEVDDNFCDILISGQAFEHIEFPWLTIVEIARVVKPGGLICIIAPNGLGFHRFPVDCWRYYSDAMVALAKWGGLEILHTSTNLAPKGASPQWYGNWQDCMLIARKPETKIEKIDINSYQCVPADLEKLATGLIPIEKQDWYRRYQIKKYFKTVTQPFCDFAKKILQSVKNYLKIVLRPVKKQTTA